jgi:hypothetical protein
LTQYGNLYPIMSKRLVNLSDPASVKLHARIIKLAFTRDIADPNHMPVTRDLSEPKRQMILKWLDKVQQQGDAALEAAIEAPSAAPPKTSAKAQVKAQVKAQRQAPEAAPAEPASAEELGKTHFAKKFTTTIGGARLK